MNDAAKKLIERIETNLKVTDSPDMEMRFTMDRDAAKAFVEHLRVTDQLLAGYERVRAALELHHAIAEADRADGCHYMWTHQYDAACDATRAALTNQQEALRK